MRSSRLRYDARARRHPDALGRTRCYIMLVESVIAFDPLGGRDDCGVQFYTAG